MTTPLLNPLLATTTLLIPSSMSRDTAETKDKHPPPDDTPEPPRHRPRRGQIAAAVILLLLAGATVLTLWLVYKPHKPSFRILSLAVYDLNTTSLPLITATIQPTIVARNPSRRASIHYDALSAIVSHKGQPITSPITLPPLVQEAKSAVVMSPVIGGSEVAVAAEVGYVLEAEEEYGVVEVTVEIGGRVRYKAGGIRTGRYGMYVRCDVWVAMRRGFVGQVPVMSAPPCAVEL